MAAFACTHIGGELQDVVHVEGGTIDASEAEVATVPRRGGGTKARQGDYKVTGHGSVRCSSEESSNDAHS